MAQEEITKDKKVLEALEVQYKHVRCLVDSVRSTITDLNFENMVPDADERFLMGGQLHAYEAVQDNLRNRIRLYRNRVKANKPEPLEENNAIRTVNTLCGPVNLVNQDKVSKEELGEMIHHCGQDAKEEAHVSLNDLLGMQVCRCNVPCDVCAIDKRVGACVKLELVGGDCICLAPTPNTTTAIDDSPKSFEKPSISFDDEDEECLDNIIGDIKEDVDKFMDCIDGMFNKKTTSHDKEL